MANLDTTIPTSLKAALDAEVTRTGRTPSSVVTAALSEYLGLPGSYAVPGVDLWRLGCGRLRPRKSVSNRSGAWRFRPWYFR